MGDGTKENPYTRKDVLRLIKERGDKAEGLDLSGKEFEDGIDLSDLNLSGIILRDTLLVRVHLERAVLFLADLSGAGLLDTHLENAVLIRAELDHAWLHEAHLQGVSLHGARFTSNTSLELIDWGNYIIGEEKKGRYDQAQHIYRKLKIWYTDAGMYDIAGEFFFREMTARRKEFRWGGYREWIERRERQEAQPSKQLCHPLRLKELSKAIFPRKPSQWALSKLISLICGYGERPFRVVASALVVVFGLAAAYYFWGTFSSSSFWDTLYYSVASFTALGYGQWAPQPTGWARGMGAAEAVIGVFMMALFLVTFTRKMTR
jgi:hypothetical protein